MTTSASATQADLDEHPSVIPHRYVRVLYLLFFLSGATGLIYEIMWMQERL